MEDIYVHQLSPFLVHFSGVWGIRWYGLSYLTGFFFAWLSVWYMAKKGTIKMTPDDAGDFVMYIAIGTLVGGRLGYVLFYSPHLLFEFSNTLPFWGALEVHKGGMASHGGIIGVIVAAALFAKKVNAPARHIIDLCVFGGSIGFFFGRLANFINGELYGRIAPEGTWWAVKFPQEIYAWGLGDKSKLKGLATAVEKLGEVTASTGQKISAASDQWLSWVSRFDGTAQRYISEYKDLLVQATQTGNQEVIAALAPALNARYPSQLIQAGLEGFAVFAILAILWFRPWKPGVIGGMFGFLYPIARIIGEQYRLPDAHIGYELFGLTRGQWLSVAMMAATAVYLWWCLKQDDPPMGGWTKS